MASGTQSLAAGFDDKQPPKVNGLRTILISFSGIDGAGKSTQIERLRARLSHAGLLVSQLAFWDDVVVCARLRAGVSHKILHGEGGAGTPEKPVERKDKNVRTWYLVLVRCVFHFFDALRLRRAVAKARSSHPGAIIFDRYIYDQLATLPLERAWAQTYARLILKLAPTPDVAYLLDTEPEAARARKPEYPLDFLHQYRASYLRLRELAGMALIHPMSQDEVHNAITKKLERSAGLRIVDSGLEPMVSA
jgi:thymidylate kinase